ncbi:hypothetical protein C0993_009557 [Termitomyces sp. T159_Od127]|nr:hypothetical protein C0993_009557 [Termitomyces sp. T159_Od127]
MAEFPWDKLRAETLRSICSDLVERSLEYEKELSEAKKEDKTAHPRPETPSPSKRTRGALVVSDYDTRHKKKRISGPGTRLPRKTTKALVVTSQKPQPRSPRRRLPKGQTKAVSKTKAAAPPSSTRREIFDGVLLSPRPSSFKGKERAEEHHDDEGGDEDAEGDVDMDHDNDGLIPDPQVESSLASSNKENEFPSDDISHTDPLEDEHVPDGTVAEDSGPAVLENTIQQQTEAQFETAILPAGEEVVAAGWTAVAQEVAPLSDSTVDTHQSYVHGELTSEDLSNIEEVFRAVAANGL